MTEPTDRLLREEHSRASWVATTSEPATRGKTVHQEESPGRVRPALLAVLVLVQALSNAVVPGLGLAFLVLLLWRSARRSRGFVTMLIVVATLSAVLLVSVIADVVGGPAVGYRFR